MQKDMGSGVWLFTSGPNESHYSINKFAEDLAKFRTEHPRLLINAICSSVFGDFGFIFIPETQTEGYVVVTETKASSYRPHHPF